MIKKIALGLLLGGALSACHTKERAELKSQVDSLKNELAESKKVEATLNDVGVLLDSIDAGRQSLNTSMVEGTKSSDYNTRLNSINAYLRDSRAKIAQLENSLKNTNASYTGTIRRLKADIEARTSQIAMLETEVAKIHEENSGLIRTVGQKDSAIAYHQDVIRVKESSIADLETKMQQEQTASKATQADLYYAEAQALETAAGRTKFAPHKKKETRKQALELYKLSSSLGKTEAQTKIDELEKLI